jgi:hypothetical protein
VCGRLRGDLLQLKPEGRTLLMAPGAGLPLSHFDLQLQFSKCSVDANRKLDCLAVDRCSPEAAPLIQACLANDVIGF